MKSTCEICNGKGLIIISCCGDNIIDNDTDICPTCGEHCGDGVENCDVCNGEGELENERYNSTNR